MSMEWPGEEEVPQREGDDYDLMTYGEAAARLVELIAEERAHLEVLEGAETPDNAAIDRLQKRIALLESSNARYKQESLSAAAFTEKFGFRPRS